MKTEKNEHRYGGDAPMNFLANGPMGKSASIFEKSMRSFQQESLRFLTRRLEESAKAAAELASCRELPQLIATQQRWLMDTARAYSDEWVKCGELLKGALVDAEEQVEDAGERRERAAAQRED